MRGKKIGKKIRISDNYQLTVPHRLQVPGRQLA